MRWDVRMWRSDVGDRWGCETLFLKEGRCGAVWGGGFKSVRIVIKAFNVFKMDSTRTSPIPVNTQLTHSALGALRMMTVN